MAYTINEAGQIAGVGVHNGGQRGFLLTPAAVPGLPSRAQALSIQGATEFYAVGAAA